MARRGRPSGLLPDAGLLVPPRASNGHGLGLSIVAAIADAHGAEIAAQAQPEGGLRIRVRFPGQPPGPAEPLADQAAAPLL